LLGNIMGGMSLIAALGLAQVVGKKKKEQNPTAVRRRN
jgi:hypothetical protein